MGSEQIVWAGRTLSGTDRFGTWKSAAPDGWWDSPDIKGNTEDRPTADGDYDLDIYNSPRLVTFTGSLRASSHDVLHEAMNYLTSPMRGIVQVDGHGPTQWADAKRNSAVRFTVMTDTYAQWQVPLKCSDPRKYGEERPFSVLSSVPTFHHGNYPADGKLIVTGSWPGGYRLNSGSGLVSVIAPVVPGKTHVLDFRRRTLRVDGLLVPRVITTGDFWETAPGLDGRRNVLITPITTKSVDATANYYLTDTYI